MTFDEIAMYHGYDVRLKLRPVPIHWQSGEVTMAEPHVQRGKLTVRHGCYVDVSGWCLTTAGLKPSDVESIDIVGRITTEG